MDKQQQDDRTTAELIRARDEGAILSRIDSLTEKLRKKRTVGGGTQSEIGELRRALQRIRSSRFIAEIKGALDCGLKVTASFPMREFLCFDTCSITRDEARVCQIVKTRSGKEHIGFWVRSSGAAVEWVPAHYCDSERTVSRVSVSADGEAILWS